MRDVHAGSTPFARSLVLAALVATLAACASGPPERGSFGGHRGRGGPEGHGPREVSLFISPFGEPFTAGPTESWPVAGWFSGADADHDGVLAWAEFEADGRRWFASLDADGSGRVDPDEIAVYETSLHRFGGGGGGGMRGGGMRGGAGYGGGSLGLAEPQQRRPSTGSHIARGGGRPYTPNNYGTVAEAGFFNYPEPVKAADMNVDNRITAEEWAQATQTWFRSLDTDHDGKLTLATLPKTPLQARVEASRPAPAAPGRP